LPHTQESSSICGKREETGKSAPHRPTGAPTTVPVCSCPAPVSSTCFLGSLASRPCQVGHPGWWWSTKVYRIG
jgi:hypothetical protein